MKAAVFEGTKKPLVVKTVPDPQCEPTSAIVRVEVDTNHFKGNFPESCSLEGAVLEGAPPADFLASRSIAWESLLPRTKLKADARHFFEARDLALATPVTHVRLNIFPDGGVSRLRLFGTIEEA